MVFRTLLLLLLCWPAAALEYDLGGSGPVGAVGATGATGATGVIQAAITPDTVFVDNNAAGVLDGTSVLTSSGTVVIYSTSATAGHHVLQIKDNAGTELMRVQQDGRIGINRTSVGSFAIDIKQYNANQGIRLRSSGFPDTQYLDVMEMPNGAGFDSRGANAAAAFVFQAGGTTILQASNAGAVWLGASAATPVAATLLIRSTSTDAGNPVLNVQANAGAELMRVQQDGKVGIGTSAPDQALDVAGTISQSAVTSCTLGLTTDVDGDISGCVSSDARLKNVARLPVEWRGRIDRLHPVNYRWKDGRDSQIHAGFIAQEVQKVIPEAVSSSGKDLLGVDPNALIAVLVREVQSLRWRVAALEAR